MLCLRGGSYSRLLGAAMTILALQCVGASHAAGQEVAITFDDLPSHGPLPNGTTRADVARSILAALRGVKDRCRGANEGARQEPCDIAGGLALRLVCFRAFVRHVKRAPQ